MTLNHIRQLMQGDLDALNQLILENLRSDVALINQMGHYIIAGGGKRVRPLILMLAARALNYQGTHHHTLAAVVEYIHTSTLLHDDVVDESATRRGNDTANHVWGNAAAVLVGDFLYSRSFQLMVQPGLMQVLQILSDTTNRIAEGEVMQLLNIHNPDLDEAGYYQVIERKTGILFAAAASLGAVLADAQDYVAPLHEYGLQIGRAFQLVDDALDFDGDSEILGKNVGDDLAEGKPTLPLIYAMQRLDKDGSEMIRQAIIQGDTEHLGQITQLIQQCQALELTRQAAQNAAESAKAAIATLPSSEYKTALIALADLVVSRDH